MPFPRLFRFVCILLVGCLLVPPMEALAARKSKRSGSTKKYSKSKKSKRAKLVKRSKGKRGKYVKSSRGKRGKYAVRGKGKRARRVDYSARPSKPQRRSSELPMTYAEWEKQQRRR
ncbi:MAG: hypothetical protein JSR82_17505 [Verrucomicrobia bacterium]|nr:hypothetical protein [Verrucomicrobiota bacterium]